MSGQVKPLGVALLLTGIIAGAAIIHHRGTPSQIPVSSPIAERDLRFQDMADGGVTVWDAGTGQVVASLTGQNGFLRATLRGLAQQRKRENDDEQTPFRLIAWADGRLTLDDPVTTRPCRIGKRSAPPTKTCSRNC